MATKTTAAQDLRKKFEQAGFTVSEQVNSIEVRKSGCLAYLVNTDGQWGYDGIPYLVVRGVTCELEDRGYQKFWYSKSDNKRFPIRRVDLDVVHKFDEEVRYLMGMKSLYNESLGSVNARTVYDRLTGRPDA